MPNAKDLTVDKAKMKMLVLGPPKTGKTNLLGTYTDGNVYVFDMDDGMFTLMGKGNVYYDTYIEEDVKKPTALKRFNEQLDKFLKSAREQGVVLYGEGVDEVKIDLIALDGSTELLNVIMNVQLFLNGRAGGAPQQNDWGPQMGEYMTIINKLKALPCHVVVICHEHLEKDDATGAMLMMPAVTGKLATKIGGKFDVIFRTESYKEGKEIRYRLLTKTNGIFVAGHRFGDAFELYEHPNLVNLFGKVRARSSQLRETVQVAA